MSKRLLYALLLIGLTVVILLFNKDTVDVNILGMIINNASAAFTFLAFTIVGVLIGSLLK